MIFFVSFIGLLGVNLGIALFFNKNLLHGIKLLIRKERTLFFTFIREMQVWGKTGSKLYGTKAGEDYPDNQMRFSLLCQVRAVPSCSIM